MNLYPLSLSGDPRGCPWLQFLPENFGAHDISLLELIKPGKLGTCNVCGILCGHQDSHEIRVVHLVTNFESDTMEAA